MIELDLSPKRRRILLIAISRWMVRVRVILHVGVGQPAVVVERRTRSGLTSRVCDWRSSIPFGTGHAGSYREHFGTEEQTTTRNHQRTTKTGVIVR